LIIVSESVQKFLLDFIRKKGLQPGDKLPSERELVQLLEVGRSSVREALQILTERGYIEKHAGKGAYVKSIIPHNDFTDLSDLFPSMDILASLDLLEYRKGIETENAFLAAMRRDHTSIEDLERSIYDLEMCIRNGTSIIAPDVDFHGTLALATQNEVIVQVYKSLVNFFKKVRIEMAINDNVENALYYHKEIVIAIKHKNPERSGILMRRHIEDVQLNYRRMLVEMGMIEWNETKYTKDRVLF